MVWGALEHVHANLPPLNTVIMVAIPRRDPVNANYLSGAFTWGNFVLSLERGQKFAAHRVVVQLFFDQYALKPVHIPDELCPPLRGLVVA
jgi:hypothetical protein